MPIRVGIDAVDVADVEDSLARFGDRYLRRVFTTAEIESCANGRYSRRLAACFAAKEAAVKVISAGDEPLDWRCVEIRFRPDDEPRLVLHGTVAQSARLAGLHDFSLSVGCTRGYVSALVIAQQLERPCAGSA